MIAFAFCDLRGNVEINTVSDSIRGAQVNAIVRLTHGRAWVTNEATDEEIEEFFNQIKIGQGEIYPVTVTRTPGN
jgi:hypothetical protein